MSSMHAFQLPASPTGFGLPGCWTLARDRAVTLGARQAGWLRVASGAVWTTLDGPHAQGLANQWGDVVVRRGERIRLTPGRQMVLEPYPLAADEDACISWEPDTDTDADTDADDATAAARSVAAGSMRALVHWLGVRWHRATRALAPVDRWGPIAPDGFADNRARAAQTLAHLTRNQP